MYLCTHSTTKHTEDFLTPSSGKEPIVVFHFVTTKTGDNKLKDNSNIFKKIPVK